MSLNTTITDGITAAFEALGNLVGDFTVTALPVTFGSDNSYTEGTPVNTDFSGFFGEYEQNEIDNVNVLRTDARIYLKGDSTKPTPVKGDTIKIKGDSISVLIVDVNSIRTYQTTFLYDLQVRK
jgi:hypothetical protein